MKYDLDYYDSKQEICNQAKRTLITYCEMNKLEKTLLEKVKLKNFHIHDYSFIDLLLMEIKDDKLYLDLLRLSVAILDSLKLFITSKYLRPAIFSVIIWSFIK